MFFYIEKTPLESIEDFESIKHYQILYDRRTSIQENATIWYEEFNSTHNVDIFYEDDDIWVYHYYHNDVK